MVQHGGARSRSGPAPDPTSGRSEKARDGWTDLPAKHTGRAPAFPLGEMRADEFDLWKVLWKRPQAAMWKRQHLEWQVAAYVRSFLEAAAPGAPASLKTAVLRMEDGLGLSTVGLLALRWRIVEDELPSRRARPRAAESELEPVAAPVRRLRAAVGE